MQKKKAFLVLSLLTSLQINAADEAQAQGMEIITVVGRSPHHGQFWNPWGPNAQNPNDTSASGCAGDSDCDMIPDDLEDALPAMAMHETVQKEGKDYMYNVVKLMLEYTQYNTETRAKLIAFISLIENGSTLYDAATHSGFRDLDFNSDAFVYMSGFISDPRLFALNEAFGNKLIDFISNYTILVQSPEPFRGVYGLTDAYLNDPVREYAAASAAAAVLYDTCTVSEYMRRRPDVAQSSYWSASYLRVVQHYDYYGKYQGMCNPRTRCDYWEYREQRPDVANHPYFGNSNTGIWLHYRDYGWRENMCIPLAPTDPI